MRCEPIENDELRSATAQRLPRPRHASASTGSAVSLKAGRVDERDAQAVEVETSVTRSRVVPGTSVTIARARADERVEQARLAHVRLADDRDLQSFANQPAAASVGQQRRRSAREARRSRAASAPDRRSDNPRRENRPTPRAARSDRTAPHRSRRSSRVSVPCELIERRARLQRRRRRRSDRRPPRPAADRSGH